METTRTAWRRWLGMMFLILAGSLMLWGFTILRGSLRGWGYIAYWLTCFAFALAAFVVALVDWVAVRRDARSERRCLLLRTLNEVAARQRELDGKSRPKQDHDDCPER